MNVRRIRVGLHKILSALARRALGEPRPRPEEEAWSRLATHRTASLFVEPDAGDREACEQVRQAFLPVLARFRIDADQFFGGSIKNEDAAALHALARRLKPAVAYQVGTFVGYSAMVIASALKAGGGGRLIACDPEIPHRTLLNPVDVAREMAAVLHVDDRVRFVRGWHALPIGDGFSERYARSIPVTGRDTLQAVPEGVDFAFIDGDHSTTATTCDLAVLHEFLKVDGTVVFHDVRSWLTVSRALESFLTDKYFYYRGTPHYYTFDLREGPDGLAAIRKVRAARDAMLRVRVLSSVTQAGVPHAVVKMPGRPFEGSAGTDGVLFVFGEVEAGAIMEVTAPGFEPVQLKIEPGTAGDYAETDVRLRPSR